VVLRIDVGGVFETGVPRRIVIWLFAARDFQIDPLIIGRDLKLVIVKLPLRVRIQKNFSHVTVPQFPSFL